MGKLRQQYVIDKEKKAFFEQNAKLTKLRNKETKLKEEAQK